MADPPGVDLVADTKKNLENRLTWKMCLFLILVVVILLVHSSAMPEKVVIRSDTALACFYGFSCCDASLRNEGCCFSVVGLPKLASKHADNREATKGAAIASQQVFCWFWSKII